MEIIQVKDKKFRTFMKEEFILQQVKRVATQIHADMQDKNPLFLSVLNGSFMFTADLLKELNMPCEVSFIKLSSYNGISTTGQVNEVMGLNTDIKGRSVIIVEDIIETGITMKSLLDTLQQQEPAEVRVCTLLLKPGSLQEKLDVHYAAMSIPNDFIVGYGLDYNGYGRNYRDIYTILEE